MKMLPPRRPNERIARTEADLRRHMAEMQDQAARKPCCLCGGRSKYFGIWVPTPDRAALMGEMPGFKRGVGYAVCAEHGKPEYAALIEDAAMADLGVPERN